MHHECKLNNGARGEQMKFCLENTSACLGRSWREGRMPLFLSWRQEGRTSVDTGSRDKSRDAFSRTAASPGRKDCLEEMWDLHAPSWGEPAPLQKSFSLWAGSKLLAQYFSYCDPRKHSPHIHPEKPWVGLQLLLDTAGWRLNSLLSFQLRCCPWVLCFFHLSGVPVEPERTPLSLGNRTPRTVSWCNASFHNLTVPHLQLKFPAKLKLTSAVNRSRPY